jgi:hypothetical protein
MRLDSEFLKIGKQTLLARGWFHPERREGELYATTRPKSECAWSAIHSANFRGYFSEGRPAGLLLAEVATGQRDANALFRWNDAPERMLQDVLDAYDAAIAIAELQEAQEARAAAPDRAPVTV